MDACSIGDSSVTSQNEDAGIAPDDSCRRGLSSSDSASASRSKKSRRSADNKRVVTFSISEGDGSRPKSVTGGVDGAPPSDSWSWRKYGQKPIKGSPYPRGYYRCSSSKGCPARKQVERSRVDPTMLVVTYSFDHNHAWPLPKHRISPAAAPVSKRPPSPPEADEEEDLSGVVQFSPDPANSNDKFSDLISEEPSEYCWFSEVGSGSQSVASPSISTDDLLLGSIAEASASLYMVFPDEVFGGGGGDEDDSLFKDLGELPEYSVVFRRSYLERQMREEEEERRRPR